MNRLHYTLVAAAAAFAFPAHAGGGLAGGLGGTVNNVLGGSAPASASASASIGSSAQSSAGSDQGKVKVGEQERAGASAQAPGRRDIRTELPGLKVHDDAFENQIRKLSLKEKHFNRVAERGRQKAKEHQPELPQAAKPRLNKARTMKRDGMEKVQARAGSGDA